MSVTQESTFRFCWAGKCGYSCDFLEKPKLHDDRIVLFYCLIIIKDMSKRVLHICLFPRTVIHLAQIEKESFV